MRYEEVKAETADEARSIIKKKFGSNARIIKTNELKEGGFLGIGAKKYVKYLISIPDEDHIKNYKNKMGISGDGESVQNQYQQNRISLDRKKEDLYSGMTQNYVREGYDTYMQNREYNPAPEKSEQISINYIAEKLDKLERALNNGTSRSNENPGRHKNIAELEDILLDNEFTKEFIADILQYTENNLPYNRIEDRAELHGYFYEILRNRIARIVDQENFIAEGKKNAVVLVGPTGVGKTTTVSKIAANTLVNEKKLVELISIDGYRLGAKYQLEAYAKIMKVDMHSAENALELEKLVILSNADLILIDTIGRSQEDDLRLAEMKNMLKMKNVEAKFILTVSAATKPREVENIFKKFEIFNYDSVIITKNDESELIGSILSAVIKYDKKLIFYTNGQRVPNDIERVSENNIISKIKGFDPSVYLANIRY